MPRSWWAIVAGCLQLGLACGDSGDGEPAAEDGGDGQCVVGTLGCTCTAGGACDPGLSCLSGLCVDPGDDGDGGTGGGDGSGPGSTGGSGGDGGTGATDGSGGGTTSGDTTSGGTTSGGTTSGGVGTGSSGDTTSGETSSAGTGGSGSSSATTEPGSSDTSATTTPGGTDSDPVTGGPCDPGLQDCAPGLKCTAYTSQPGYCCVDANMCVPVIGSVGFGMPCTRSETNDDCAAGLFCMSQTSASSGPGTCMPFCDAAAVDPCPSGGQCIEFNDGVLPLCQETCNPIAQDCDDPSNGCYAAFDTFLCAAPGYDPGAGEEGDACYAIQACKPGLICVSGVQVGDCIDDSCCTPVCDLGLGGVGNPACSGDKECVPWWDADPPVGYEDVGACTLPP